MKLIEDIKKIDMGIILNVKSANGQYTLFMEEKIGKVGWKIARNAQLDT